MQTDLTPQSCPTCGHLMQLKYCPQCGEKRLNKHDFTLKHFAEEALEGITHFDNKFIRTLKRLMFKPGLLAEDFSNGMRSRYMRPFQLYLVCNLFFFVGAVFSNPFSQPMGVYWNYTPYTWFGSREMIGKKVNKVRADYMSHHDQTEDLKTLSNQYFYSLLETKFNQAIKSQSKIFLIVLIPVYALLFMIFFYKKRYPGEHLILATHFTSALLIFYLVFGNTVNVAIDYITDSHQIVNAILGMLFIAIYLSFAFRRFYYAPTWKAVLAGFTISALTIVVLSGYRIMVFYNIMLWS